MTVQNEDRARQRLRADWRQIAGQLGSHISHRATEQGREGRADVVGIFPNEPSTKRLVEAILLKEKDGWQCQHRNATLETMASRAEGPSVSNYGAD